MNIPGINNQCPRLRTCITYALEPMNNTKHPITQPKFRGILNLTWYITTLIITGCGFLIAMK